MEGLKSKNKTIQDIVDIINQIFGYDYFSVVDFWDADNCAIGLKRDEKLIYISNWD